MNNQNVIFDVQNKRIGFAESDCQFGSHYSVGSGVLESVATADHQADNIFYAKKQDVKRGNTGTPASNSKGVLNPPPALSEEDGGGGGHKIIPDPEESGVKVKVSVV